MRLSIFSTSILYLLLTATGYAMELESSTFKTWVDKAGVIHLPENYRQTWSHLGSWIITDKKAPGHGMHDVYIQPEALAHYQSTGKFPDGSVLIKEVRRIKRGIKTTGEALWAGDIKIWFVMVKDNQNRFEDNPHWANGWGWALFEKAAPSKNVSKGFAESCLGCHLPAQSTDWVFVEGYPSL